MSITLKQYYNELILDYSGSLRVLELSYIGDPICEVNGETIVHSNKNIITIVFMSDSPENVLMNYYGKMKIRKIKAYDKEGKKINDINFSIYSDDISKLKSKWETTDTKWEEFNAPSQKYSPIDMKGILKFNYRGNSFYMHKKGRLVSKNNLSKKDIALFKRIRRKTL